MMAIARAAADQVNRVPATETEGKVLLAIRNNAELYLVCYIMLCYNFLPFFHSTL